MIAYIFGVFTGAILMFVGMAFMLVSGGKHGRR